MTAAALITFRETLETSLVVGIVLAYLHHTLNNRHRPYVWAGVIVGVLMSIALAVLFQQVVGGFEGRTEEIYEGIMMLTAAALISWMILWMLKQRRGIRRAIENDVSHHLENDHPLGLFFLVLVSTLREGIETVIFLQAAALQTGGASLLSGGLIGIVIAVILSVLLFKGIARIPLGQFFTVSGILLILFAAGLVAHGVHELEEAGVLPIFIEHVWDMNAILPEDGTAGSILKGLFGYNGNPSLLEVIAYAAYLLAVSVTWKIMVKKAEA